ncbi:MAG: tetratricopeptide repeat protein [Flavobacteriales bacterium]|jgi:tetratricopeptide (TPR) repeat protein|nr:tetratricopeptide repeat protein [Flavobacteriales bacterium]
MRYLYLLILLTFSISCIAQDGANLDETTSETQNISEMSEEERMAAAKEKARSANGDTTKAPSMTTYEEAAKSYDLAQELEEQRKYDDAQAEYDKAIEVDPNFVEAYVKRGGLKFQKIEFPAAMEDYNRAVEISENLVEMHEYKASIKKVLADFEGSKIEGSKADYMNTKLAEALYHRGHLKRFMEDNGGGCTDLRRSLDLGYGRAKTDWPDLCQ